MVLKEQIARQTGLSLVNTFLSTGYGVISFFFLARLLSRSDIGIIGITAGFFALLHPLQLSPEIVLFREYDRVKADLNRFVASFLVFWAVRSLAILAVVITGAYFLFYSQSDSLLFVYMVGMGIVLNLNLLQAMIQEIFFVEFRQTTILKTNLVFYLISIASLVFVYWWRDLRVYLLFLVGISLAFALIWLYLLVTRIRFQFRFDMGENLRLGKEISSKVALWTQLSASSLQLIYKADLFALSFVAAAAVIGDYTIALMFGSVFFLVPQILQKMCSVGIARASGKEQIDKIVNIFLKYSMAISILQIGGYLLVGPFLLSLVSPSNPEKIFRLGFFIVVGVNLFNMVRPLHSLALAKGELKRFFGLVSLPSAVLVLATYFGASFFFGVEGTAKSNIVAYGICGSLILLFAIRHMGFSFQLKILYPEEKEILSKAWKQSFGLLFLKKGIDKRGEDRGLADDNQDGHNDKQ